MLVAEAEAAETQLQSEVSSMLDWMKECVRVCLLGSEINADYKSLYDYDAEDDTEITIKENDLLFVESEKDGWYYGYRKANPAQKGNFPSNFVERC